MRFANLAAQNQFEPQTDFCEVSLFEVQMHVMP